MWSWAARRPARGAVRGRADGDSPLNVGASALPYETGGVGLSEIGVPPVRHVEPASRGRLPGSPTAASIGCHVPGVLRAARSLPRYESTARRRAAGHGASEGGAEWMVCLRVRDGRSLCVPWARRPPPALRVPSGRCLWLLVRQLDERWKTGLALVESRTRLRNGLSIDLRTLLDGDGLRTPTKRDCRVASVSLARSRLRDGADACAPGWNPPRGPTRTLHARHQRGLPNNLVTLSP